MKKILLIALSLLMISNVNAQKREHLLGVRAGYNISSLDTRPDLSAKGITTYQNYSVVYTLYHDLWGKINLFGFQAAVSKSEQGYMLGEDIYRYDVISVPLISLFHFDFWNMRLLINAGCFGGYRTNKLNADGSGFDDFDKRFDYGFIVGGGFAFVFKPFEVHLEGNYNYSLSYLHDPKKYSETDYLFTYPHQLIFSVTLNIHL